MKGDFKMSHANSTPNYNLPEFISSDKPAWLVDINGAFSTIDNSMKNISDTANQASDDATDALADAASAQSTANTADVKASGVISSIADIFDTTATYTVGTLVMYNSLLYKCISAVTVPGPWNSSKWERISVEDVINTKITIGSLATVANTGSYTDLVNLPNVKSITRIVTDVTTGASGNVDTGIVNDGRHFITAAIISGNTYACTPFISGTQNTWFIKVRGVDSWNTVNNQNVALRYWVVETFNA